MERLAHCIRRGDQVSAEQLVPHLAQLDMQGDDPKLDTLLTLSARSGHLSAAIALCTARANIEATNGGNATPLYIASQAGHLELVCFLYERGQQLLAVRASNGWSPLHAASSSGHTAVVQQLLDLRAEPIGVLDSGATPLHAAANHGHEDVVSVLLAAGGAQVNCVDLDGLTSLHVAAARNQSALIHTLLNHSAAVDAQSYTGATALVAACQFEALEAAQTLINAKADVARHSGDPDVAPLLVACAYGRTELVRLLVASGAPMSGAAECCVRFGHEKLLQWLDVNCRRLHYASVLSQADVRLLLRAGEALLEPDDVKQRALVGSALSVAHMPEYSEHPCSVMVGEHTLL